jgi:4-aminobutyrate aminotransferase-like enzyme
MSSGVRPTARNIEALMERRRRSLSGAYRLFYSRPLHIVRGQGTRLYDADGVEFLDAYNNVASVGHSHPRLVDALSRQAATLNTHTRYLGTEIVDYAEALLASVPAALDTLILTCTGSESNDLACRMARAATRADGFIVTEFAYHGTTSMVSGLSPSLGAGVPLAPDARTVPAPAPQEMNDGTVAAEFAEGVRGAIASLAGSGIRPAALIVDTVFSSDGLRPHPAGFLAPAVAAVREAGGIFIADEVQAGFGRTGEQMWGFARHDLVPDIVTMGKPMGGGHPIGGVVARSPVADAFAARGRYFNTFAGNPVSCAVGLTVLDIIRDEALLQNALDVGRAMADALRGLSSRHDAIAAVRAVGLFAAVQIRAAPGIPASRRTADIVDGLRDRRVLVGSTGADADVIKIRPPLPFSLDDLDVLLGAFDDVLTDRRSTSS